MALLAASTQTTLADASSAGSAENNFGRDSGGTNSEITYRTKSQIKQDIQELMAPDGLMVTIFKVLSQSKQDLNLDKSVLKFIDNNIQQDFYKSIPQVKLEFLEKGACMAELEYQTVPRDLSARIDPGSNQPYSICVSLERLEKKYPNTSYVKRQAIDLSHELTHLAGGNEAMAMQVQSVVFIKGSFSNSKTYYQTTRSSQNITLMDIIEYTDKLRFFLANQRESKPILLGVMFYSLMTQFSIFVTNIHNDILNLTSTFTSQDVRVLSSMGTQASFLLYSLLSEDELLLLAQDNKFVFDVISSRKDFTDHDLCMKSDGDKEYCDKRHKEGRWIYPALEQGNYQVAMDILGKVQNRLIQLHDKYKN